MGRRVCESEPSGHDTTRRSAPPDDAGTTPKKLVDQLGDGNSWTGFGSLVGSVVLVIAFKCYLIALVSFGELNVLFATGLSRVPTAV